MLCLVPLHVSYSACIISTLMSPTDPGTGSVVDMEYGCWSWCLPLPESRGFWCIKKVLIVFSRNATKFGGR